MQHASTCGCELAAVTASLLVPLLAAGGAAWIHEATNGGFVSMSGSNSSGDSTLGLQCGWTAPR
ncbi:hypothetical protein PR003_g6635 [Phytophthora rubi]|uniref:Uncharacterized protein n=1 Tax=Phytophthora rubi TaxID=129364 RepID=A0A6A4FPU0_9STRA|nr:hypothetical protein PR003_g6635 [Phytophthora rubi]